MTASRVSISMCTYNGAAHVEEQLESFAAQTRPPDELIVCDDGSQDETTGIVQAFARRAPFDVRLIVNEKNLGFAGNFAKSIDSATGDLVFLSDQDDVWRPNKIARFVDAFATDPSVGLVFCDADLVDEALAPLGRTWWESRGFGARAREELQGVRGASLLLKDPTWMVAGAMMAFAARYRDVVLPIPDGWMHDGWIATVLLAVSRVGVVPEPLNLYRQHSTQVYGASTSRKAVWANARARGSSMKHFLSTVRHYEQLRDRLRSAEHCLRDPTFFELIEGKVAHWRYRAEMRRCSPARHLGLVGRELLLGRYQRYSQGPKSVALDLLSLLD